MPLLGLITDIHERVAELGRAREAFAAAGVERIIFLGDVFEMGRRLEETTALLDTMSPVCLWGNHDFGLCSMPAESLRDRWSTSVAKHFARYQPLVTIADCCFSHVSPHRNLHDIAQLWDTGGWANTLAEMPESFVARPERVLFMGHHHRWIAATESGPLTWDGSTPLVLAPPQRFFVMLAAVCYGWCATYDTDSAVLTPIRLVDETNENGPAAKSGGPLMFDRNE